jgi:hypothetical protein
VRYLVASALLLVCGLVLLWRELAAPMEPSPTSGALVSGGAARSHARPPVESGQTRAEPLTTPAPLATDASPPGGVRAWSPTAAPAGGPDPFAAVLEIRTADDTRSGLVDE